MFFTTKEGTNVIQLGSRDTEIGHGHIIDEPLVGTVSFTRLIVPVPPDSDIDRTLESEAGWTDEDRGVHTRLVFTDTKSIDALINQLEAAKELMIKNQPIKTIQDHNA